MSLFKRKAAQLVSVRGVSVAQASQDLDVHATRVARVREFGTSSPDAFLGKGQLKPDDEELRGQRREVEKLKTEHVVVSRLR